MNKIMFAKWLRMISQLSVLTLFMILPWTALGITGIYGTLYALEILGVPFADPAGAAQILATLNHPGWMLLIGAMLSLVIALILGRIFCSWICPYGFFSEIAFCLSTKLRSRKNTRQYSGKRGMIKIFLFKSIVLIIACLLFALFSFPVLQFLSFPGELSRLPVFAWQNDYTALLIGLALPVTILVFEFILQKRFWCTYICPQSVLLGLASGILPAKFPALRINWNKNACSCKKEFPCANNCDLGLDPRRKYYFSRAFCNHCGKCVEACAKKGKALGWSLRSSQL